MERFRLLWITSGCRSYHLQFITLEPNSLFLPVLLHADMVFYVHTGSGRLSWTDEDHSKYADLRRGDVYRMAQGTVFFLQSSLETERHKLRIHAIFVGSDDDFSGQATRVYSSIRDMVLGFDKKVLQATFKVPEEVIEKILNGTKPPAIVHGIPRTKRTAWEMEAQFMRGLIGTRGYNIFELNKKKQKTTKLFNIFSEDKDFENCNGWSTTVTRKRLSALKDVSIFMVNLTSGSMMGPHWNPRATEIAVVLHGQGMIRVVCSSISNETDCRNTRLKVEEGDVFAVPRFHPMAQMAFNNDTFVFMGFSTSTKKNHPQFLAGKASVLQTLDKGVLAVSFNIENTTLDRLFAPQRDSVILGCTSCAEEELRMMEEEMEKEKEAERKREEEEARKKAEEKRREEEEARKRGEEEARKEEEERRKREEEEEEEKRRKEEEEEAKRREKEQEEARKREEEEARKEEEERRKREEQEEEEEEEAAAKRREEEEEEAKRREKEQEEARQQEQEEARRRQEEEEAKKREQEQEQAEKEEEEARRRQEEEEAKKIEQEQAEKEEEEARRQKEEEEAQKREEEEARKRQEEEEAQRREEEAKRRQEEQEGQQPGRSEEEQAAERERKRQEEAQREEEAARQREKEMERQQQKEGGGKGEGQQVYA
ncbi:RmlC-like cupins superfamily protein [Abeliophyllum distichum]|uniref:RmlC-like cupins superfamily protein n=1 Tax=Abeliophyllum distichum TaxID=126358 RepID=A0ABD1SCX0_9LAMI